MRKKNKFNIKIVDKIWTFFIISTQHIMQTISFLTLNISPPSNNNIYLPLIYLFVVYFFCNFRKSIISKSFLNFLLLPIMIFQVPIPNTIKPVSPFHIIVILFSRLWVRTPAFAHYCWGWAVGSWGKNEIRRTMIFLDISSFKRFM